MPIFDQGYQHWNGPRSGLASRWLAVARHGVRATFKVRFVKLFLIGAWLPAIVLVSFLALWGLLEQRAESVLAFLKNILPPEVVAQPEQFRSAVWTVAYSFFFKAELAASLFLVLLIGPNLISKDLRFNAFPLYFSRPLRRIDYFVGKLGVIGFFLAMTVVGPAIGAYLAGLAFSLDLGVVRDTHRLLWGGVVYGLIIAVSAGTLMLALSSLSRRSIYVGLAWAGFCFLTMMLSGILIGIRFDGERRANREAGLAKWVAENPTPAGVTISGPYSYSRTTVRGPDGKQISDDAEQGRWIRRWQAERERFDEQAVASVQSDWRRVVSYPTNLDRVGDWLLQTDRAWVTFGSAIERPRRAMGPMAQMHAGGRLPKELMAPANERFLADQMVLQYPVTWSLAVLGGLWLLSVLILLTRVKSLDRLK